MSLWSQILIQERFRSCIELLSLFHDYSLGIIRIILSFVTGIAFSIISNNLISNSPIVTIVEVIWTIIPIFILIFLAIPSLQILYFIEENDPYITLKITGNQWYWSYEIIDLNLEFDSYIINRTNTGEFRLLDVDHRVILPVNKDIRGLITAADVLHCWALPRASVKADAVPGRLNQVSFSILRSSILYGQCSEICGANHSFIPICVESLTNKNFLNWCNQNCVGLKNSCKLFIGFIYPQRKTLFSNLILKY